MGSGASSPQADDEEKEDLHIFPKYGVRLSFCNQFIESCGGREALRKLTTHEVCRQFIKPATKAIKTQSKDGMHRAFSYCEMLLRSSSKEFSAAVGIANVFICHTWSTYFLDTVDAMISHFNDRLDETVVWMDIFSINQHHRRGTKTHKRDEKVTQGSIEIVDSNLSEEWWFKTFPDAIAHIGYSVIVFSPWSEAQPLSRLWCLWEMYLSVLKQCRFEVAVSSSVWHISNEDPSSISGFWEDITALDKENLDEDDMNTISGGSRVPKGVKACHRRLQSLIHFQHSECSHESDRDHILHALQHSTNANTSSMKNLNSSVWKEVNHMVLDRIGHWMISVVEEEVQIQIYSPRSGKVRISRVHFALARLYEVQGNHKKAVNLYRECLDSLRNDIENTSAGTPNYADFRLELSRAKTALADSLVQLYITSKKDSKLIKQHSASDTDKKTHMEIEELYLDSLTIRQAELPDIKQYHANILSVLNRIIYFYDAIISSPSKAKVWMIEKLRILESQSMEGDSQSQHEVVKAMNSLASLAISMEDYIESAGYYENILETQKALFGENHLETLQTMNNLGITYFQCCEMNGKITLETENEQFSKARKLLEDCLQMRKEKIDQGSAKQKKVIVKSKRGLESCDATRDMLATMRNLVTVYRAEANQTEDICLWEKAISLQEECLSVSDSLLGGAHSETLSAMMTLGELYCQCPSSSSDLKEKGRGLIEDCLTVQRQTLGDQNIGTILSIHALACCYHRQYSESNLFSDQAQSSRNKSISKRCYEEARALYEECLNLQVMILGDDHRDTLRTRKNLDALMNC